MAGLAILFQAWSTEQEREIPFRRLLKQTAQFKQLDEPDTVVEGKFCTAAKLDAPSSLHCGIIRDEQSGSWLLAAGTLVALTGNNDPRALLDILLKDYLDNGSKALDRYDGHFALAIYNGRDGSLSIISDPMGLFAIYYARRGQQIFISSSAMAVAKQGELRADTLTIDCFLRTSRPYGEKTLWQDVKRVRPATLIKITPEKFEELEYWTPTVDEKISRLPMKAALELADEKICRNFQLSLSREGKVWADLTGGFDTRLITMYLDKLGIPFIAYCFGPQDHPDIEISQLVSQEMGWEYYPMALPEEWTDEQFAWLDTALGKGDGLLNVFQLTGTLKTSLARSLKSFVTIVGMGADEWRYHIFGANTLIAAAINNVNFDYILDAKIMQDIPIAVMRNDRTVESRRAITEHLRRSISDYRDSAKISQIDIAFLRYRHPIHTGAYLSAQSGMIRSFVPFCLKELENFGFSMNHQWRIKYDYRFVRNLMERGNPRLANIPTESGAPVIPIRLNTLCKFIPFAVYLTDHVVAKASKKLLGKRLLLRPQAHYTGYPRPECKKAFLRWAIAENLLTPAKMQSGVLYNAASLEALVSQSLAGAHRLNEFLERVVTVEMALRATGATVE